ncbi:hypothetical protein [uncultured Tenacibaculum sp.]|uniref:hypothetical protein n=1 Tax=uncultured Tenacibaculum sp. TaxID=174713 RepID=UPI00260B034C|nr:hypothetical protein [uncultured Tenacibaculum sp.]
MNNIKHIFLCLVLVIIANACNTNNKKAKTSSNIEASYLGQKPPGLTPKVFAPNMFSKIHRDVSAFLSPDLKEFYFTRRNTHTKKWTLMVYKYINKKWQESLVGPRIWRPIFAPDGKIMHLGNKYMERTDNGWSDVKSLGPMFDREDWGIMRLSSSRLGTYVFDDYKNNDVIRISIIKNGKRQEPTLLNKNINSGKWTAHPFIAPDESYLIFDSEREDGVGKSDLYISFKQKNGLWSKAINMGDKINTSNAERGGYVSPDGKYFFFNSNLSIHWVDAKIIDNLRLKQ